MIVIETTAPQAGKLRVTYDFKPTIGVVDLTDYDLMNAREKLQYEKEAGLYEYEGSVGYEENNQVGSRRNWMSHITRNIKIL